MIQIGKTLPLTGEEVRTKPLLFGITLIVLGILISKCKGILQKKKNKQM